MITVDEEAEVADASAPELFVERLHRLAARGYRAAIGSPGTGLVTLTHPGHAPPLLLWADGLVVESTPTLTADDEARRVVIDVGDGATFERFVASVPLPTARQRFADLRIGDTGSVVVLAICLGLLVLILGGGVFAAARLLWR